MSPRIITPSDVEDALFGSFAGVEDTSLGQSSAKFPGHWCYYSIFEADGAITAGWILKHDETASPGGVTVKKRDNNSRVPLGVALHDCADGEMVKVCLWGFCDVMVSTGDRYAIGDLLEAGTASPDYHKAMVNSWGTYQLGQTASKAGAPYSSGWVRALVNPNVR